MFSFVFWVAHLHLWLLCMRGVLCLVRTSRASCLRKIRIFELAANWLGNHLFLRGGFSLDDQLCEQALWVSWEGVSCSLSRNWGLADGILAECAWSCHVSSAHTATAHTAPAESSQWCCYGSRSSGNFSQELCPPVNAGVLLEIRHLTKVHVEKHLKKEDLCWFCFWWWCCV